MRCGSCGAPLPKDSGLCEYCGSYWGQPKQPMSEEKKQLYSTGIWANADIEEIKRRVKRGEEILL